MTTIKASVDEKIEKHRKELNYLFITDIQEVYDILVEREKTGVHKPITLNGRIEVNDVDYERLRSCHTTLDNFQGHNINKIFKIIPKTEKCQKLNHPFVHLKYSYNHNCLYNQEKEDLHINFHHLYQFPNIKFDDKNRIKICYYDDYTTNHYHLFIFLDSLTYNNDFEFVYDNGFYYYEYRNDDNEKMIANLVNKKTELFNNVRININSPNLKAEEKAIKIIDNICDYLDELNEEKDKKKEILNKIDDATYNINYKIDYLCKTVKDNITDINLHFIINIVSCVVAFVILYKK
jgi:hypothetical protein